MLKNLYPGAVMYLSKLINSILYQGYFPTRWKLTVFIPKSNHASNYAKGYRLIRLLSCVDKIAESIILSRLKKFAKSTNLVPPHLYGFRGGQLQQNKF
jgi:hypothetical protein